MTTKKTFAWSIVPNEGWGPIRLGISRAQAVKILQMEEAEIDKEDLETEDPTYLCVTAPWGELEFDEDRDELTKILVLEEPFTVSDVTLSEPSLEDAITAFSARSFSDTRWVHGKLKPPLDSDADRELLRSGTLWLVSHGIGIELHRGHVESIKICRKAEVPSSDLGPLTPQQLELSTTADLFEETTATPTPSVPLSPQARLVNGIAFALFLLAIGVQCYRGYLASTYWSGAKKIDGVVLKVMPEGATFPELYRVEYAPTKNEPRQIEIPHQFAGHMYKVGETMELLYLPEHPERATTLTESRNKSFIDYIPSLLGIAAVYMACVALIAGLVK